jgi:hypothetical protein
MTYDVGADVAVTVVMPTYNDPAADEAQVGR